MFADMFVVRCTGHSTISVSGDAVREQEICNVEEESPIDTKIGLMTSTTVMPVWTCCRQSI